MKRYPVVIEQTATGYSAFSPDVPGCASAGDTPEQTLDNFQAALAEHFEAMREIGEAIPEPRRKTCIRLKFAHDRQDR